MPNERYSRILVTGFGPFKDVVDNPSSRLAEGSGAPYKILDVAYAAVDSFIGGLDAEQFDILLMLGVAQGRDRICPEFYARNYVGKTADVVGQVRFGAIDANGPLLIPTTLWKPDEVAEWTMTLPIRASLDAGSYLCNYVSYLALERFPAKRVGFLHVPGEDKLPLETQTKILDEILRQITSKA